MEWIEITRKDSLVTDICLEDMHNSIPIVIAHQSTLKGAIHIALIESTSDFIDIKEYIRGGAYYIKYLPIKV